MTAERPFWGQTLSSNFSATASPQFTPDSTRIVYNDHYTMTVAEADGSEVTATFPSSVYRSTYHVVDNSTVIFTAGHEPDITVIRGNIETGEETELQTPPGALFGAAAAGHAYIHNDQGLALWRYMTDELTAVDTRADTIDGPPLVVENRIIYILRDGETYQIRTADPLAGESARTLVEGFRPYHLFHFRSTFDLVADQSAILFLKDGDLWQTAIADGQSTVVAQDVLVYRYMPAVDTVLFVRGRSQGPALEGDGLYVLRR